MKNRIRELSPILRKQASMYQTRSNEHTSDDLYQHAVVRLIELANNNVGFAQQQDGYILSKARFLMLDMCRSSRCLDKKHVYIDESDNLETNILSYVPDDNLAIEDNYVKTEEMRELARIAKTISDSDKTILSMYYMGYTPVEIADALEITTNAYQNRRRRLFRQLREQLEITD